MADVMEFPKTMKDFVRSHSFKDEEEIYTNGSMLIQTFRVEQALEHYEKKLKADAISEFAQAICKRAEEESVDAYFPDGLYGIVIEIEELKSMVSEIAERMKEGAV